MGDRSLSTSARCESTSARSDPPGLIWYFVAVIIALVAFAGAALFLYYQLDGIGREIVQVLVPGATALHLEQGRYTIFHEHESVVDSHVSGTDVSGLIVSQG